MVAKDVAHDWVELMRAEYLEMPGLALSERQASRLWNLDGETCRALLDQMVQHHFLKRTPDNLYVRHDR